MRSRNSANPVIVKVSMRLFLALLSPFVLMNACTERAVGSSMHLYLSSTSSCSVRSSSPPILAVTTAGTLVTVDPQTLRTKLRITSLVDRNGGLAVGPNLDVAFVTAPGSDGLPAVWAVPLAACHRQPTMVARDAELPSISPDGGFIGYVTLNSRGEQTGIDVSRVDSFGRTAGRKSRFAAISVPPPLPIAGLAVGRDDSDLAVWGGFVDPYLGKRQPTVGTLDPALARSLGSLVAVFDGEGVSGGGPLPAGQSQGADKAWWTAPVYLPDGELLVGAGNGGGGIEMPFSDTAPGVNGGGIREIASDATDEVSIAGGPNFDVAWVGSDGTLNLDSGAAFLPFGPAAVTEPSTPVLPSVAAGHFKVISWTVGRSAATTPLPPVFHVAQHLPNVVGMSEADAARVMNALELPVLISLGSSVVLSPNQITPSESAETVVSQNPPAGYGVACQCEVTLTVSSSAGG